MQVTSIRYKSSDKTREQLETFSQLIRICQIIEGTNISVNYFEGGN